MANTNNRGAITEQTAEIVSAYVRCNNVATADFHRLVVTVAETLSGLGQEAEPAAKIEPAVPVEQSIRRDRLVCLVCGKPFKSLRRHLNTAHGLTAEAYRALFALPHHYPMVAAASSEARAAMARHSGLGRQPKGEPEAAGDQRASPAEAAAEPAGGPAVRVVARPVRGRRAAKRTEPVAV